MGARSLNQEIMIMALWLLPSKSTCVCQASSAVSYCGLGMSVAWSSPHLFVPICHPYTLNISDTVYSANYQNMNIKILEFMLNMLSCPAILYVSKARCNNIQCTRWGMTLSLSYLFLSACVFFWNYISSFYLSLHHPLPSLHPSLYLLFSNMAGDAFLNPWMHTEILGGLASALLKMGCCHLCSSWSFSPFQPPSQPPLPKKESKIREREGEMRVGGKSSKSAKLRNVFSLKQVCEGIGKVEERDGVSEVIRPSSSMAAQHYKY